MQRIRMSLPFYEKFGWQAEIVTIKNPDQDTPLDFFLTETVPTETIIHYVNTLKKKLTSKIGLGSAALRSLFFYRQKVSHLLKHGHYDLIFFSTTQFPLCILGAFWKKKFGVPYIIDMQDPWQSDYYINLPKHQRPKKYWFSYRLNKYLEPIAMRNVDGLMSVSQAYIDELRKRYDELKDKPAEVITFGAFDLDFSIVKKNSAKFQLVYDVTNGKKNLVYIGRGGYDMQTSVALLFDNFKKLLVKDFETFHQFHFHFIGTSYAANGTGTPTIAPIAEKLDLSAYVTEMTDRIGFFESIHNLANADGLFIIGSNSSSYTASKLYPYILSKKPLLALLHSQSSANEILNYCNAGIGISIDDVDDNVMQKLERYLKGVISKEVIQTDWQKFEAFSAAALTSKQCDLFNRVTSLK
jgi:hypothetical protein